MTGESTPLRRARLERRLGEATRRRLCCLVGGAGYGKTTLLAQWAGGVGAAWHTLTAADRDLPTLVRALVRALDRQIGGFCVTLPAQVWRARGPGSSGRQADALAALLCDALRDRTAAGPPAGGQPDAGELILVLDDYHELSDTTSARLVEGLWRQAPPGLHLVLASRLDLPRVERLRAYGDLVEIPAAELAFTEDETAHLLSAALAKGTVSRAEVAGLHRATGGWPVAVRLAAAALDVATPGAVPRLLAGLPGADGPLYDYVAHEVFEREPADVQALIRAAAELGEVTPELCAELGLTAPGGVLRGLARRGLFVEARDPGSGWFRLMPLAREFVRRSHRPNASELACLHGRAAVWRERHGAPGAAIDSMRAIGDDAGVARLLREQGPAMLAAGQVDVVAEAARWLPDRHRDAVVWRLAGEAEQVRGDWDAALACLREVAAGPAPLTAGVAWRLGRAHYLRGEPDLARQAYQRCVVGLDEPHEEALLAAWHAAASWAVGDLPGCAALAERALALATASGDPGALAAAHGAGCLVAVLSGDRAGNDAHYHRAVAYAERAGDVLQLVRLRTNRASHLMEEGEYEAALTELSVALPLAEVTGFAMFHALARHNRGDTLRCLGRLAEAVVDLTEARQLYQKLGSGHVCRPQRVLGDLYAERGDEALARQAYEEAIRTAEACREIRCLTLALAGLARVTAYSDPDEARRAARRALSLATGPTSGDALAAAGWVALATGDATSAARYADRAGAQARRHRDRAGLARTLELAAHAANATAANATAAGAASHSGVTYLGQALGIWRELGNVLAVRRCERELACEALASAPVVTSGPVVASTPVAIQTLGRFLVLRDGVPTGTADWQSRKARDLVKILVARRGRPTPRSVLMAALWPDESPERLGNRFSVALSTARAVLDPARRFPPHHLVVAEEGAVRLDEERVAVDVWRFLADADRGLAAHRHAGRGAGSSGRAWLDRAEAAYRGDFLEADLDEEWAEPLRGEARTLYLQVCHALADQAARDDHDEVVRRLLPVLERDPYDERAHLRLVGALDRAGNHGEARRRYRDYVDYMVELDVEAAPFPVG